MDRPILVLRVSVHIEPTPIQELTRRRGLRVHGPTASPRTSRCHWAGRHERRDRLRTELNPEKPTRAASVR